MKHKGDAESHGGIHCPNCGGPTRVRDSRPSEDNTMIRRRRLCVKCGERWTTFERIMSKAPDRSFVNRVNVVLDMAVAITERMTEMQMILKDVDEERSIAPRTKP